MQETIKLFIVIGVVLAIYFFSYQIQKFGSSILRKISSKIGTYSVNKEYSIQRYIYLHRGSKIARLYVWINEQLIATGLKRNGVTPIGYMIFWGFVSVVMSVLIKLFAGFDIGSMFVLFVVLYVVMLVMTRVLVAERMEKREADVMDAIDLIVPEIHTGVKNAILVYIDNFAPSLQSDFKSFISNIQDRGYSFADAMYILSDNLGEVFKDFAQKAIYFEEAGEVDMIDIFTDIIETNRLRRDLRYSNNLKFSELKTSFVISSLITFGYFLFIISTDKFSRYFFLTTTFGRLLLLIIILVVFGVLSYITTIKSKAI